MNIPKYLIIHCTDVSYRTQRDQLYSVNLYHKQEEFPLSSLGYYVGYHYLYTGGKEYQCRAENEIGAHCNNIVAGKSMNVESIGLCVGFDGDIEAMPEPELSLLRAKVQSLQTKYDIPDNMVRMHREFNLGKTCPGTLIDQPWIQVNLLARPAPVINKPVDQQVKQETITNIQNQLSLIEKILQYLGSILSLNKK